MGVFEHRSRSRFHTDNLFSYQYRGGFSCQGGESHTRPCFKETPMFQLQILSGVRGTLVLLGRHELSRRSLSRSRRVSSGPFLRPETLLP